VGHGGCEHDMNQSALMTILDGISAFAPEQDKTPPSCWVGWAFTGRAMEKTEARTCARRRRNARR